MDRVFAVEGRVGDGGGAVCSVKKLKYLSRLPDYAYPENQWVAMTPCLWLQVQL